MLEKFLSKLLIKSNRCHNGKKILANSNRKTKRKMPFVKRNLTKGKILKNRMNTAFHWHPQVELNH